MVKNISEVDFASYAFWTPEISVDNSIETQEDIKYRLELVQKDNDFLSKSPVANLNRVLENLSIRVTEMRKLKV